MEKRLTIASVILMVLGAVQLLLGLVLWSGTDAIEGLHILIGIILVVTLWTVGYFALRAFPAPWLAVTAFALGLVALIFGLAQTHIDTGSTHGIVQVIHLLIGLSVIGFGQWLIVRMRAGRSANTIGA